MSECYLLSLEKGRLRFTPHDDATLLAALTGDTAPHGYAVTRRLGDPELLHCAVLRLPPELNAPGGIFFVQMQDEPLFAAVAESNLAFAHGLAHFGKLVSYARYGADIFENPHDDDDD